MPAKYHMDQINLGDLQQGTKIVIPTYQRGLVWKLSHQKEFLDSVKSGYPVGVVLVYIDNGRYKIIDGLQRLSTIKAYIDNPLKFFNEKTSFQNESSIEDFIKEINRINGIPANTGNIDKQKREFKKELLNIMRGGSTLPESTDACSKVFAELSYPKNGDLYLKFIKFYEEFVESMKLPSDVSIPAIVYEGDAEYLPTVFHNLNTGSVALTKYEIYASIWPFSKIKFDDDDINNKVISKYQNLKEKSKFDVDVTPEQIKNDGITLFEYCYSLGEILCDSELSGGSFIYKSAKTDSCVGFDLLSLVCGLGVNESQKLSDVLYLGSKDSDFLVKLKNALIECTNFVENAIKYWVFDFHENDLSNDSLYHSYYMVLSAFKNLYDFDLVNQRVEKRTDNDSKRWASNFKKYAFKHYLCQTISGFWSINRQVADLKREIDNNNSKYVYDIGIPDIETAVRNFFAESKEKSIGEVADKETKLVINYLYKMKQKSLNKIYFKPADEILGNDVNYTFDIEHIIPKQYFTRFTDKTFCKSYIANLCYLAIKDNRSKGSMTLYEYANKRPALNLDEELIKFIDYPDEQCMQFINCDFNSFNSGFNSFIDTRAKILQEEIVELLSKQYGHLI